MNVKVTEPQQRIDVTLSKMNLETLEKTGRLQIWDTPKFVFTIRAESDEEHYGSLLEAA